MQRDRLLLEEIIDAAERVIDLTATRSAEELDLDRDRREALLWNFTVIGEAIGQLSNETRVNYPDVSWSDPVRLRNWIVHGYWSVDVEVLLATARDDLPAFLGKVRAIATSTDAARDDG
jgi:uncharacterized protein with HEPN domain